MRIEEDQCSYTNHQNNVTNYNMVNQHKIQNYQLCNKIPLPLSFTTVCIVVSCLVFIVVNCLVCVVVVLCVLL